VAADRTRGGIAIVDEALAMSDKPRRDKLLTRALDEYRHAAQAWAGYLVQDENARDADESRFWLADAPHRIIAIEVALDRAPSPEELLVARKAAVASRDISKDDTYLASAAFFVVDIAQKALDAEHARFVRTQGKEGIERRTQPKTTGDDEHRKVIK